MFIVCPSCSGPYRIPAEQIAPLGATYGSVGAVVVLLIWLSWNVNAIFYGGAFTTEMEIAAKARAVADFIGGNPLRDHVVVRHDAIGEGVASAADARSHRDAAHVFHAARDGDLRG